MSSSLRSATLTERKPPPIGVVIGPLSATPVSRIASRTSGGSGLPPCFSITSAPASRTSQSSSTPVASRTRRVASVSSGPVPSPGMRTTLCATGASVAEGVLPPVQRLVVLMALAGACLLAAAACLANASGADGGHGILFVRWPHAHGRGGPQIYLWRRRAGSRRMSPSPSAMDYPAWAPDGKLVAFAGFRGSRDQSAPFDIWIMRPDGTHLSRVTNEAARRSGLRRAVEPSWSPDGRRIVFVRQFSDRPDRLAVVSPRRPPGQSAS